MPRPATLSRLVWADRLLLAEHSMGSIWILAVILAALALVRPASAQTEVKILDYPDHVYSYEPVYVVFEVRNHGPAVAVPSDGCSGLGAVLEVGGAGERLYDPFPVYDCWPDRLIWLDAGDRWLSLQSVELGAEGEFDVQAVLRSTGKCGGRPVGPHRDFVRERDLDEQYGHAQYDCWAGEVRSQRARVVVDVPDSEVDLAAAEFLDLDRGLWSHNWKHGLIANATRLFTEFPTSHYTYAASWAAGGTLVMLNVVLLQPDNPLNPWAAGAMAAGLAARDRPCAPPYKAPAGAPSDLDDRYRRVIAAYPPPKALQDYLRQQALEYSTEECPEKAKAGEEENAQPLQ